MIPKNTKSKGILGLKVRKSVQRGRRVHRIKQRRSRTI
uniref:Ribosomal protein L34 n=1 Tax=Ascaris lumbricoides TaxID=6252 RepID=A0A0M3HS91_ASCLU